MTDASLAGTFPATSQMRTLAVRTTDDLWSQLDVIAQLNDRSVTEEIRITLEAHVGRASRQRKKPERDGHPASQNAHEFSPGRLLQLTQLTHLVAALRLLQENHLVSRPLAARRSEMVRGIYVPIDAGEPLEVREFASLQSCQLTVDGWIEAVDIPGLGITIYVNEGGWGGAPALACQLPRLVPVVVSRPGSSAGDACRQCGRSWLTRPRRREHRRAPTRLSPCLHQKAGMRCW